VQVLDGEAEINLGGKELIAKAREVVVMPASLLRCCLPWLKKSLDDTIAKRKNNLS
jgi:hypothetical protein